MFIPAVFYFLSSNKRLYPLKFKQNGSGKEYRISGSKRDKKRLVHKNLQRSFRLVSLLWRVNRKLLGVFLALPHLNKREEEYSGQNVYPLQAMFVLKKPYN